jgi:hypothetical protein
MNPKLINFLGWISAFLFIGMNIPQMITLLQANDLSAFSVTTWIMYDVALGFSTIYLLSQKEKAWPVIANQSISCCLCFAQIIIFYVKA